MTELYLPCQELSTVENKNASVFDFFHGDTNTRGSLDLSPKIIPTYFIVEGLKVFNRLLKANEFRDILKKMRQLKIFFFFSK